MGVPRSDRPLFVGFRPGAWILLLAPVIVGLYDLGSGFGVTVGSPGLDPGDQIGVNYEVYYYAAEELLAGGNFYDVSPPGEGEFYEYLYPPITILLFLPTLLVDPTTGYWLFIGLNVLVGGALALFVVRYVESMGRRLGWIDAGLVFAFCVLSSQMVTNYYFGNVNLLLGAGVGAGVYLLEVGDQSPRREATAGALLALVALIKVIPALLGLYLLRIRAWWATASALAVGLGGLVAGELLFAIGPFGWDTGDRAFGVGMTERWIEEAVIPRGDTQLFVGGIDPDSTFYITIQRPLSHLLWGVVPGSPRWLRTVLVVGSLAIGIAVAVAALRRLEHRFDRLVGAYAAAAVAVVVMPSLQYYVALTFLPLVVIAFLLEGHPVQLLVALGGLLLAYASSPAGVLADLERWPTPIEAALDPIATVVTTQLLGLAIVLLACAIARRLDRTEELLPAEATAVRPAGPPLREWLADRGITLPGRWDPTAGWTVGDGRKDS